MKDELYRGKYRIKSIRLREWDYSADGYYFITICTKDRIEWFGEIKNEMMGLNEIGCIVAKCYQEIPNIFPNAKLDEWQIMPNHMHGILVIDNEMLRKNHSSSPVETRRGASLRGTETPKYNRFGPLIPNSLSSMINHFKGAVTKWCRKNGYPDFAWQPLFYDHIIRTENDLNRIRQYIIDNPFNWERDRNKPKNLWM